MRTGALRLAAVAGVLLLGAVGARALIADGRAGFTGQSSTAAGYATAQMAPPTDPTCRWTSTTQLLFSWSLAPAGIESSTDVWRSDTVSGAQTLVASVPVATTGATVTPPAPVTTARWLTAGTRRAVGSWTSAQPARIPTSANTANNRLRKIAAGTGTISTVAGAGGGAPFSACSYTGPSAALKLNAPEDVAVDAAGNLYVADTGQACVRRIDPAGNVTRVAGGGATTACNTSGAATAVNLSNPTDVAVGPTNTVIVADTGRNCVRAVSGGTYSHVAGGGATTACGASVVATSVSLSAPEGVGVDVAGRVLVTDTGRRCTRMATGGTVSQVGLTGTNSASGNQGPALAATMRTPARLAVDPSGHLWVSDRATGAGSSVVRRITGPYPP